MPAGTAGEYLDDLVLDSKYQDTRPYPRILQTILVTGPVIFGFRFSYWNGNPRVLCFSVMLFRNFISKIKIDTS